MLTRLFNSIFDLLLFRKNLTEHSIEEFATHLSADDA